MARIRSIKPELRTSITVSLWPREVRLFFILLWGYLDDHGRGVDDGMLIAADCFPRDRDITAEVIDDWLEVIAEAGPVCRYVVDGRTYLHCPNWAEHQRPQHPGKSRIPPCPDDEHDAFTMWRGANPPREFTRSRKSHEGLMRVSPPVSGTSGTTPGGLISRGEGVVEGQLLHLSDKLRPNGNVHGITAGHPLDVEIHEDLMRVSGESHEGLTPEQGAGSREQGAREQEEKASAAGPADDDPEGALEAVEEEGVVEPAREDVELICLALANRIEANGSKRPNITQRWRDAARRMIDLDGRTLDQVLAAIDWCQSDEFWQANILSTPKLRQKYDQLRLAALRQQRQARPNPQQQTDDLFDRAMARANARMQQENQ
jgi:hypothetical protein